MLTLSTTFIKVLNITYLPINIDKGRGQYQVQADEGNSG